MVQFLSINYFYWVFQKFPFFCVTLYNNITTTNCWSSELSTWPVLNWLTLRDPTANTVAYGRNLNQNLSWNSQTIRQFMLVHVYPQYKDPGQGTVRRTAMKNKFLMRREEEIIPTRCHCMLYCTYDKLNMFRALLCPSSGALDYMCVVTAYCVQCCKGWKDIINVK